MSHDILTLSIGKMELEDHCALNRKRAQSACRLCPVADGSVADGSVADGPVADGQSLMACRGWLMVSPQWPIADGSQMAIAEGPVADAQSPTTLSITTPLVVYYSEFPANLFTGFLDSQLAWFQSTLLM